MQKLIIDPTCSLPTYPCSIRRVNRITIGVHVESCYSNGKPSKCILEPKARLYQIFENGFNKFNET